MAIDQLRRVLAQLYVVIKETKFKGKIRSLQESSQLVNTSLLIHWSTELYSSGKRIDQAIAIIEFWGARPLPSIRQTVMIFQGDVDNQTAENIPSLHLVPYGSPAPAIFIHDWANCHAATSLCSACLLASPICQTRPKIEAGPKRSPRRRSLCAMRPGPARVFPGLCLLR